MPHTIATPSTLSSNIDCLGERNADLAEKLADTRPCPNIRFEPTAQGVPAVILGGTPLCSRHRPLDEAQRLAEQCDVLEHAVVIVLGFGAGYHVERLAALLKKTGVIIIFEPDIALLRSVLERIDHSSWLRGAPVIWITDPDDRGVLGAKLQSAESIIAQGVTYLQHPASRQRLAEPASRFASVFAEFVNTAKVTFLTTLMRATDTVRNLLANLDHYAAGAGIAQLQDAARGYPAIVVSAGPSLQRNIHQLADPAVRSRCVIIAAQTTLKPLLDAGVRPHFVTALDFHEISRRFYVSLTAEQVDDTTLIVDPKAHPVILDAYPGPLRCCSSAFLDELLGEHQRPMGTLPAGATVAHLAVYVARFLGCDPIVLTGQDLAFTDGLYYTPGTAIAEVWAPELSPFNTIEMMEWQRIVRHRVHLKKLRDVHGRPIYTDRQMLAYLQQFERDFSRYEKEGVTVIDATEGGIAKQHTTRMPLAEVLRRHASRPLPPLPKPTRGLDPQRLRLARDRVASVRRKIAILQETSRRTASLIRLMRADQQDPAKMDRHFRKIEQYRNEVDRLFDAFSILSHLNQLGSFKRVRADRRLQMTEGLDPLKRQRAQLDRDLENVIWINDAAHEMLDQLDRTERLLAGRPVEAGPSSSALVARAVARPDQPKARVAALVPIDPARNGLGVQRSLATSFGDRSVLQATLERLGRSQRLEAIILISPRDFDVEAIVDRDRIALPVEVHHCDGSPFGHEQAAIAAARGWSPTSWRGGIGGMCVYDEVLCPQVMSRIMRQKALTAALLVGPDWPLVDVSAASGCDAIIQRHLELPEQHNLVFSQAPPGLSGCVISASLMQELSDRNRLSTTGGLLAYQPRLPQHDPIARSLNVQIDERVSRSRIRATFDAPRYRRRLTALLRPTADGPDPETVRIVADLERHLNEFPDELPQHVILELCTDRTSHGLFSRNRLNGFAGCQRPPLTADRARRLFEQLAAAGDAVVTLGGVGDPLLHERFDEIVRDAKEAGILGVHVRTELLADRATLKRLLACGVDVVSVDLHADSPQTYHRMMGLDRFGQVVENIQYLLSNRQRFSDHGETAAFGLPWIVPRLQRRIETFDDIEGFFDRWQASLGTAIIEGRPPLGPTSDNGLAKAVTPPRVMIDEGRRRMTVYSDGSIPISELDLAGRRTIGGIDDGPLTGLWQDLLARRRLLIDHDWTDGAAGVLLP